MPARPAAHLKATDMKLGAATQPVDQTSSFAPKFDAAGLIVCITQNRQGQVLMVAYMNREALERTLETGTVHYWSRSRNALWRKGDTSGQVQTLIEMRVDCDQDALLLTVEVAGDGKACHTGRRSCFYRRVVATGSERRLAGVEGED